jgi:prepilin-type N-terminal cleavage/methylation domain-containing protein
MKNLNNYRASMPQRSAWDREQSGFTLIELLLVMAIIGVLSSMALGVMRKAQDDARESATRARIAQIEAFIAIEMEDYEVRRLPISNSELIGYCRANPNQSGLYPQVRNLRRQILMDIMNTEMPRPLLDSTSLSGFAVNPDLARFPSNQVGIGVNSLGFADWLDFNSSGIENYPIAFRGVTLRDRLAQLVPSRVQSYERNRDLRFDLPGEYLYAILERIDVDGTPAIEYLGNAAVGNSDDDEFKEVVDAWGDPMQLRIWQIAGIEIENQNGDSPPGTDVWEDADVNPDFETLVPLASDPSVLLPKGYKPLDPTEPRDITKIRAEVVSRRLIGN